MSEAATIKTILRRLDEIEKKHAEFVAAVTKDYSKVLFRMQEIEKQVAAIGVDQVVAAPPAEPTPSDELPGAGDMEQFKPEGFEGGPELITQKEPPKEVKEKAEGLFE